ncbi:MAG: thaumatin family protein [Myxococcota bacterium]
MFARHGCDANGQNCASADCAVNVLASSNQALPYCPNALCPSGCTGDECPKNCTLDNPCGPSHKVAPGSTYEKECPNDGTCAPQTGLCNLGEGGQPPATLAEFTLTGTDFYDVSVINGINMGISMAPDLSFAATDQSNPYTCGTPGAKTQASGQSYLKPCPWTVNLTIDKLGDQTNLLRQVLPVLVNPLDTEYPACPCTTPGQVCGLAINVKNTTQAKFVQTCGTDLKAYWTADQICGTIAPGGTTLTNLYPLPCTTDGSTNQNAMQTHMINLLGCIGADGFSCYQTGAQCGASAQSITNLPGTSIGCGCPTAQGNPYLGTVWPQPGPAVTNNCTNSNPDWVEYIQPWIAPLKTTCPTAYTFPYDDVTSTFTCQASAATKTAGSAPGYYVNFFDTTYVMP